MADINHAGPARTEGDGISYKGLGWSMVLLTVFTLLCYALVVGLFKFMESRAVSGDTVSSPLAAGRTQPQVIDGRVEGGRTSPLPSLLVDEPLNLERFRAQEDHLLTTYGWVDENAGVVRLPIDQAKDLLLQRGLPVREPK